MGQKRPVKGALAGKATGKPHFQDALVGGKEKLSSQIEPKKIDILGKAGMQAAGEYMGKMVFAHP